MKINYLFLTLLTLVGITFTSCIKDEADNMESDIVTATIENANKYLQTNAIITTTNVVFRLKPEVTETEFAPIFTLSEGATIVPESGTKFDFSQGPVKYTVTSKDGKWKKEYIVSFLENSFFTKYSFENVKTITNDDTGGIYHDFYDLLPNGKEKYDWASGNLGFDILAATLFENDPEMEGKEFGPDYYPTHSIEKGFNGKGIEMVTRSTGELGSMFSSPMAAGNLYLGSFNFTVPAINSTLFGIPYAENIDMPHSISGYFKYKAGEKFLNNSKDSKLTKDTWDVYAIIFEAKEGKGNYLMGSHNFKDPRMVAIARIKDEDRIETNQWTRFEIPFTLLPGKKMDYNEKKYMITIVFSSSIEGAKFNGAIGSTLSIDEVEINL
ncbi:MAG: PCMD domain-containing protein [Flavobacteriaceae bacterium]|jgi:hypothetical protein|nr:PCMD domain-containing protein [Flavobacteriaceae bacterium]